jgi:hypothetical protein
MREADGIARWQEKAPFESGEYMTDYGGVSTEPFEEFCRGLLALIMYQRTFYEES